MSLIEEVAPRRASPEPVRLRRAAGADSEAGGCAQRCRELVGERERSRASRRRVDTLVSPHRGRRSLNARNGGGGAHALDVAVRRKRFTGVPTGATVIYNGRTPVLFNPHCAKQDLVLSVGRVWDAGKQVDLADRNRELKYRCASWAKSGTRMIAAPAETGAGASSPEDRVPRPQSEGQLRELVQPRRRFTPPLRATSRSDWLPWRRRFPAAPWSPMTFPHFENCGDTPLVTSGENDASSLAEAIARLRADRELRLTYANLAYNRARQRFTASRMVDEYLDCTEPDLRGSCCGMRYETCSSVSSRIPGSVTGIMAMRIFCAAWCGN